MNILFITAEFPYPPNSGGRIYTWQRIKYLSKNNDIFLFSIIDDGDRKYLNDDVVKNTFRKVNTYKRKNKIIQAIKGISYPFSVATRRNEEMFNDISKLIKTGNIDLVVIDHPQMLINCDMNSKVPKVLTQHNIEYQAFESMYKNSNNFVNKIIYKREHNLMKQFEERYYKSNKISAYSFISEEDKKYFEEEYKNTNTILIPPGVDEININSNKKDGYNIVFTGKMDYEPNVQAMKWFSKEIFPSINNEIPDAKLYIVGKNPTEYIQSLSSENIVVTGTVESIEQYLKLANIVVIPLLSGGGVKIKLMEALQYGNIVVSTSKGTEGTQFRDKKEVLISDDPNEFSKYCVEALKNPIKYTNMINNAMKCIEENYLWSAIGRKYEEFLNKMIQ